jgi:DNA primase
MPLARLIAWIERKWRARREAAKDNIVTVVGGQVLLKRRGRMHIGLCPFHPDRNPSLFVNGKSGFFFCFGCKTGGSAKEFLRLYHARSRSAV